MPAIKLMIEWENKVEKVKLDNGRIFYGGKDITEDFTREEKIFFQLLLVKRRQIVGRELLAESLWGKNWEVKYSDWALDRLVYRLRQKMQALNIDPVLLKTRKKKGFVWG